MRAPRSQWFSTQMNNQHPWQISSNYVKNVTKNQYRILSLSKLHKDFTCNLDKHICTLLVNTLHTLYFLIALEWDSFDQDYTAKSWLFLYCFFLPSMAIMPKMAIALIWSSGVHSTLSHQKNVLSFLFLVSSCSPDPATNSETKNPEFFTNFSTHAI